MALHPSDQKFVDGFLADLRNISNEARKKHSAVKEAAETAIIRLRNLSQNGKDVRQSIVSHCLDLLQPILLAAESGSSKLVILGLQALQRLFAHETIADASLPVVMSLMWTLMENHTEELKLIQTITIILTTSNVLHGEYLAKCVVICLRMHFSKDQTVSNTAGAAIRQLVPLIFEKALEESKLIPTPGQSNGSGTDVGSYSGPRAVHSALHRCTSDAYLLLQDLCQVMIGEQPTWLVGMTEMTRVLALELIESVLLSYRQLFDLKEFSFLLKDRLCPLLIKLISPCIRHSRASIQQTSSSSSWNVVSDKPSFPVTLHLVRIIYVLLTSYCDILRTESEIFYSLLIKFIDSDKVPWTKLLALEVFFKLVSDSTMVIFISQTYSTKAASEGVFCDMINTINNFILSVFVKPSSPTSGPPQTPPSTPQLSGTVTLPPTFTYKDVNIQLLPLGKQILLESRELEAPLSSDNYGMSIAFSCLCYVSRTILELEEKINVNSDSKALQSLVQNSWCGMLSAIFTLLEASCDDSVTDSLLHICKVYIKAAGLVNMDIVREAFITGLCKSAFPLNYTIGILKAASSRLASYNGDTSILDRKGTAESTDAKNRNQIVAFGTPLLTSYQGTVMLTSKNITCLNALLEITITLGDFLHGSWVLVLASLQHLAWILGINQVIPGFGNGLAKQRQRSAESGQNTIMTTSIMSDLPELTRRFDEVFKHTKNLSDLSLEHVVHALAKLSLDSLEIAAASREPSLFAVAKLVDVSLVNIDRGEIFYTVVTSNLTEVSANINPILREWGTDAITILVKEFLASDFRPPLSSNSALQEKLLHPLLGLSKIAWSDVRLKQFNCLNHVILSSAEKISTCWKPVVEVIGAVDGIADESLIRAGFKCLQGVVSDHLRNIPFESIEQCAEAATKYGSQALELNVSLTAIGILWNIADYIYQNRAILNVSQERLQESMLKLYKQLSQLCLDVRPEVRKSAAQTLFLAIASHGAVLDLNTWHRLINDVCYTLLKCLDKYCMTASEDKIGDEKEDKVLIHHSRDTAKKQWAETWAMVLPSVTKTVIGNLAVVMKLKQPQQVWQGLLVHIQRGGLSGLEEVVLAALRCVEEILMSGESKSEEAPATPKKATGTEITPMMWEDLWKTYTGIGTGTIDFMRKTGNIDNLPSQKVLTFYTSLFRRLYGRLDVHFTPDMLRKLQDIFPSIMLPLLNKNVSKVLPCKAEISPLQESVLQNALCIQQEMLKPKSPSPHLITELFNLWLKYSRFSTTTPVISNVLAMDKDYQGRWWAATFSLFSETAIQRVIDLYQETFTWKLVMDSDILSNVIQVLYQPLKLRETDAHQTAWRVAVYAILKTVRCTLPTINTQTSSSYRNVWIHLARALDEFLYGEDNRRVGWGSEEIDCEAINFVRLEVLPLVAMIPPDDLKFVIGIFNNGSLHRSLTETDHVIPEGSETFATTCFEALLDFELFHSQQIETAEVLNIPAVLLRCDKLLTSLSPQSDNSTIVRSKNALRCIRSVIISVKQTSMTSVDRQIWHDVISLYPKLVALIPIVVKDPSSMQFDTLLSSTLLQYSELIQPPLKF